MNRSTDVSSATAAEMPGAFKDPARVDLSRMSAAEKRALLATMLKDRQAEPASHALASAQRRLWLFEQVQPGTTVLSVRFTVRFTGGLDVSLLERVLEEIQRRHESLRSTFSERDGEPVQVVHPPTAYKLPLVDLSAMTDAARDEELVGVIGAESAQTFDLGAGPLWRARLIRMSPRDHRLMLVLHHLVCDGWSIGILLHEITTLYGDFRAGRAASLPRLSTQFRHAVQRQQTVSARERRNADLAYWTERLRDCPAVTELPADRPRPAVQTFRGATASLTLTPELSASIAALSRQEGVTGFITLLSALNVVIGRHTAREDLVIGAPVAGRTTSDAESLIGCFVNTVALRTDISGDPTFRELLARARHAALDAFDHQEAPFDEVLEALAPARDPSRTPVFQIFLNVLNVPTAVTGDSGLDIEVAGVQEAGAKFDLTLYVVERRSQLTIDAVYNADLYDAETMQAFLGRFERLLGAAAANPGMRIGSIRIADRLVPAESPVPAPADFVTFDIAALDRSIVDRFELQVDGHADDLAVASGRYRWTYRQLDGVTNATASRIVARVGADAGTVGLLCEHDAPMLAAMLGALKANKTYVPLDPSHPPDRIAAILQNCGAAAVIADRRTSALAAAIPGGPALIEVDEVSFEAPRPGLTTPPDALAYLLYTSGSTGVPKGVMQNHRNVLHFIRCYTNNLRIAPSDRLSLIPSYCFDAAVMDIYAALLNGAALMLCDVRRDGIEALGAWLDAEAVTIYHSTPTVFRHAFHDAGKAGRRPAVRLVVLGGEPVPRQDFETFKAAFAADAWFVNGLGPTESTVTLQHFLPASAIVERVTVPVGRPVDGTDVFLLDERGQATDLMGELVVRSRHVALGYWQQPAVTAKAFVAAEDGRRDYRSGDLARRLADGTLEFIGRKDFQVKVRGFRIELGEIESALLRHPGVQDAIVVTQTNASGDAQLVAYVTGRGGVMPDEDDLRVALKRQLPDYMVPAAIVVVEAMPQTRSGKIDRSALPAPAIKTSAAAEPPSTATEQRLAELWTRLLGVASVGRRDDFFLLGGHSLLATRLVSHARQAFALDLPLRAIFDTPVLADLASAIDGLGGRQAVTLLGGDASRDELEI